MWSQCRGSSSSNTNSGGPDKENEVGPFYDQSIVCDVDTDKQRQNIIDMYVAAGRAKEMEDKGKWNKMLSPHIKKVQCCISISFRSHPL